MKNIAVATMGGIIGVGLGILGSILFLKRKYKKAFDAKVDKLYKEWYGKDDTINTQPSAVEEQKPSTPDPTKTTSSLDTNTQPPSKEFSELIDYASMYKGTPDSAVAEVAERLAQSEAPAEKPEVTDGPVFITADEFESHSDITSLHLYYYSGNQTLINEEEEEFDPAMTYRMVGNLLQKAVANGESHVYIRNEKHRQEFEIVIYNTAYAKY